MVMLKVSLFPIHLIFIKLTIANSINHNEIFEKDEIIFLINVMNG